MEFWWIFRFLWQPSSQIWIKISNPKKKKKKEAETSFASGDVWAGERRYSRSCHPSRRQMSIQLGQDLGGWWRDVLHYLWFLHRGPQRASGTGSPTCCCSQVATRNWKKKKAKFLHFGWVLFVYFSIFGNSLVFPACSEWFVLLLNKSSNCFLKDVQVMEQSLFEATVRLLMKQTHRLCLN